jgi:hypothetical protein
MTKLEALRKWVLTGVIAFPLVCLGLLALQVRKDEALTASQARQALSEQSSAVSGVILKAGATFDKINSPCVGSEGKKACGTLADLNQTLLTIRLAAGQIVAVSEKEKKQLDSVNKQEAQIASDTHKVLVGVSSTLAESKKAIAGVAPIEQQLNLEIGQMRLATAAVTALASDPDIKDTAKNIKIATGSAADTTTEIKDAVHDYLHPKWPRKLYNGVKDIGGIFLKAIL